MYINCLFKIRIFWWFMFVLHIDFWGWCVSVVSLLFALFVVFLAESLSIPLVYFLAACGCTFFVIHIFRLFLPPKKCLYYTYSYVWTVRWKADGLKLLRSWGCGVGFCSRFYSLRMGVLVGFEVVICWCLSVVLWSDCWSPTM